MSESAPHGDFQLDGVLVWFILGLVLLAIAGAAFMAFDAWRRPREAFIGVPRTAWAAAAFLYLGVTLFGIAGWVFGFDQLLGAGFGSAFGAFTLAMLPVEVAYLLRVVFPSSPDDDQDPAL